MFYIIYVRLVCNIVCMYLTHVSIIPSYIVNTYYSINHVLYNFILYKYIYLCRAIARVLMFIVLYMHASNYNVMLCSVVTITLCVFV